ncbi:bactofilin family protein [Ferviditalea candida]|uniref:Polymer-forming cytoskeletal protein n=1 Tax=Ferviditalea candida TaxID=3108399 RepID=A0ABU5ZGA4_9BACL|nr:polymer-forming cytoskeletal protein [Paenibacillaceae bacterium T2]
MFAKKKSKVNPNTTDTIIGEGSVFEGRIKSEAGLRIEGHVIGDIECQGDVEIGEHGNAKSNISARNITIAGTVHGNIITKGALTLTPTGKLYGNSNAESLMIAQGAIFHGSSKMESKTGTSVTAEKSDSEKSVQTEFPQYINKSNVG